MFEDRVLKLLFKQAVEFDMGMGVIADSMELSEEYLRMRRTKSIANENYTHQEHFRSAWETLNKAEKKSWADRQVYEQAKSD